MVMRISTIAHSFWVDVLDISALELLTFAQLTDICLRYRRQQSAAELRQARTSFAKRLH